MKRYTHACTAGMVETPTGDWVRWSDAEPELTAAHAYDIMRGQLDEVNERIVGLKKENVKLREALERIASNKADDAMRECIREGASYHRILEDIAQAALEEK